MNAAATLHRLTRHGSVLEPADRQRLVAFRPLDPSNRPQPFKRYVGHEPVPLRQELAFSSAPAASVLSGAPRGVVEEAWDEERLARLLFFSNGVSRTSRSVLGDTTYFRTAMSAGNLHPVEIYVICGDLVGVPAGVHHFAPLEFGLTELRRGDFRGGARRGRGRPTELSTHRSRSWSPGSPGAPRGNTASRGFRHLYWDAGTMLANLLALEPSASVRVGFADEAISQLIGIDGVSEYPLALVVLPRSNYWRDGRGRRETGDAVQPLDLTVETISPAPIEFPLVTAAQRDGDLADATAVRQWRTTAGSLGTPTLVEVVPPTRRIRRADRGGDPATRLDTAHAPRNRPP